MLGLFRSMFQSRIGIAVSLAFLVLIAIAFASADITGSSFGGIAGGDRAAVVGGRKIGTAAVGQAVSSAFEQARRENPTLTMEQFVASGAVGQVLDDMIDRAALYEFGQEHGMAASDSLIDSEIVRIPAFRGADGRFSQEIYRQALAQQGLSDRTVRQDLAQGLMARQLLIPVSFGARVPDALAQRYAELAGERRKGSIAMIPSTAFLPKAAPNDQSLAAFYKANAKAYTRPERRVIRYAVFGDELLRDQAVAPTEAEVARAYAARQQQYAPSETRSIVQVVVPTEAAAQALLREVRTGRSLADAAKAKGLLPRTESLTREALAGQSSAPFAQAVFSAARGALAGPARSGLGWHVARVEEIRTTAGKTLAQARPEIVAELSAAKRRSAIADLSARIEEQIDEGANLADVAQEFGLTPVSSEPLLAGGTVWGKPNEPVPAELSAVLQTAFVMDENEPQLAEVDPGQRFVLFEVEDITPAAAPPLAQIRPRVAQDWALAQGSQAAKAAADKVIAALAKGTALPDALRALSVPMPAPLPISASREELASSQQRVPPPVALMFGMAEGSAKRLEAPARQGWFVVDLDDIVPGTVTADDPRVATLKRELATVIGREHAQQFRRALRDEVEVERNPAAISAVERQLTGGGQ